VGRTNGSSHFVLLKFPGLIPRELRALGILSMTVALTYKLQKAKLTPFDPISRRVRGDLDAAVEGAKESMLLRLQHDSDVPLPYHQIPWRGMVCACESREPFIETTRGRILVGIPHALIECVHKMGTIQLSSPKTGAELDQQVRCCTTVSGCWTRTPICSRPRCCYDKANASEKNCKRFSDHGVEGRKILLAEWVKGRCEVSTS